MSARDQLVILIRHATPRVDPSVAPADWALSPAGLEQSASLAKDLTGYLPAILLSSTESKAAQTAEIIGKALGLAVTLREALQEHRRPGVYLPRDLFESRIAAYFENPSVVVFGEESCDEVGARFQTELDSRFRRAQGRNVLAVTHGTAVASFVRRHWNVDAFALWTSIALPAYVALRVPGFGIVGASGIDERLFSEAGA